MSQTATQPETVSALAVVQKFYACYAAGDLDTMKREVLSPDVEWIIPGHHPLAGTKRGAEEIVAYFNQLQKASFKAEVITLSTNGDYVVDVHRGWGEFGDAKVDMNWVLAYRVENGRITWVQNFAADQHAVDLFFWKVWGDQLKPIPERLQ